LNRTDEDDIAARRRPYESLSLSNSERRPDERLNEYASVDL
jgi:hypothetical protein